MTVLIGRIIRDHSFPAGNFFQIPRLTAANLPNSSARYIHEVNDKSIKRDDLQRSVTSSHNFPKLGSHFSPFVVVDQSKLDCHSVSDKLPFTTPFSV